MRHKTQRKEQKRTDELKQKFCINKTNFRRIIEFFFSTNKLDYQMALGLERALFDESKPLVHDEKELSLIKVQLETNQLRDTHFNMPKVFQYMIY